MSQLESYLTLLHSELGMEADAAARHLDAWAAQPDSAEDNALALRNLFERCTRAVGVLGLEGLASYLQQLGDSLEHARDVSPEHIAWLAAWRDPVLLYVMEPAQELTIGLLMQHLRSAPQPFPADVVAFIETLLATPPQFPADESEDEPSDLPPLPLVDDTSDVDPDLLHTVLEDSPEHLQQLEDLVRSARSAESPPVNSLREAQRIAHTLKGSMLIVGLSAPGGVAHRLEDILEFSCALALEENSVQDAAYRDMAEGISLLQQMIGHRRGEDAPPDNVDAVVQRLDEWGRAIRRGDAKTFEPAELAEPVAGSSQMDSPAQAVSAGAAGSLRMDADQLGVLVRKAGQCIARNQRIQQTLQESASYLRRVEASHTALLGRLRELELIVARQVVTLRERTEGFDPLEMDRYDALSTLSRFISEAAFDKQELASSAARHIGSALGDVQQQLVDLRGQRHQLVQARLVPVGTLLPRLRRNVQQTAKATGKAVALAIVGQDTSMDADVLAKLTEPLLHIVRNAIDHGIEPAAARSSAGKPETGSITLTFRQTGNEMIVSCQDDGAGIDRQRVVDKARRLNLVDGSVQLSDQDILSLILQPGFSVKDAVTEISGRGVGMDVVAERVRALRGRLELKSEPGRGLEVTLRLPVASGMIHCVIARSMGQLVAIPSEQVIDVTLGDDSPAESLASWMGWAAEDPAQARETGAVNITARGMTQKVVLSVDEVVESRELLIQDLGSLLGGIPGLSAAALRPDGKPLALLNIAELEQARVSGHVLLRSQQRAALHVPELPTILVVDDSVSVRKTLSQLVGDNGFDAIVAADGFEALEQVAKRKPALVLTDLEMPNLNGLELTRRLRALPEHAQLPIIMVTSRSSDKHRTAALEAGVNVVFTKPYDEFDLLSRIRALVAGTEREIETGAVA